MKNLLILMTAAVLAACSHKPPKPYGKFFPINAPVHVMMQMNNQPLESAQP